jgi:hypothetical protein
MLIADALKSVTDLKVEFASGSVLTIKYRPSSYTVADISDVNEKTDPMRLVTMIRDMVVEWDLESEPGAIVPLALPPGSGNVITSDGETVKTKKDKQAELELDPIRRLVPIYIQVAIIRAVNDDQSAGN